MCAGLYRRKRAPVVKMDVGDNRHRTRRCSLAKNLRRLDIRCSQPHDVSPGLRASHQPRGKRVKVVRIVGKHRLHAHRRTSANSHATNHHLPRLTPSRRY